MALGTALDRPSGGGDEDDDEEWDLYDDDVDDYDDDGHSTTQWTWYCRKCPVLR